RGGWKIRDRNKSLPDIAVSAARGGHGARSARDHAVSLRTPLALLHTMFRILVGTDFSAAADEALARAVQRGLPLGAQIDVVHVQELATTPALEGRTFATSEAMHAYIETSLEQRVRRVRAAGLPAAGKALCGSPPREILRHARRLGSDLIILGARG